MRLLLSVYSDNEDYSGGCDVAYLDLTPELARVALKRIDLVKAMTAADPQTVEAYFWDYSVVYFSPFGLEADGGIGEDQTEPLINRDVEEITLAPDAPGPSDAQTARVECCQMLAKWSTHQQNGKEFGDIMFTAIPKDASFYVRTTTIGLDVLREVAGVPVPA